jgi:hypothetical protein
LDIYIKKRLSIAFEQRREHVLCIDSPIPINETPPLFITARISAKSKFTNPVVVTSSVIPFTALVKISSAI